MKNTVALESKVQSTDSHRPLRKYVVRGVLSLLLLVSHVGNAQSPCCDPANPITVNVYSGFNLSGGGAPYSGFVGSLTASSVSFATNTGYAWHPFGLPGDPGFGADITGCLNVATDGEYTFTLDSDDGSLLFIDGNLVVDNGGPHPPQTASGSAILAAGTHTFEVQFFACCGDPSGVDLILPEGVSYTCCGCPSIDLSDLAVTCISCNEQTGSFVITNVTDEPMSVTVESIDFNIVFIGKRGVKTECDGEIFASSIAPGDTIAPGATVTVMYTVMCPADCPPDTRAVQVLVDVTLVGRDKVFHASGGCGLASEDAD